jgi:hypothetical protein
MLARRRHAPLGDALQRQKQENRVDDLFAGV